MERELRIAPGDRGKGPYSGIRRPEVTPAKLVAQETRQRRLEAEAAQAPTGREEEVILRNAQCRLATEPADLANITEQGIVLPPVVW